LAALAFGCNNTPKATPGYTISGRFDGFDMDSVWLFANQDDRKPVAGSAVKNGFFQFEGTTAEPSLGFIATRGDKLCDLVVENGDIKIEMTGKTLNDISITGSPANDAVTRDFARLTEQFKEVSCDNPEKQQELIMQLWKDGATTNRDNYCGVMYIMNLAEQIPNDQLQALYNGLSSSMKATKGAASIREFLNNQ